ncbi:MAG: hypothetical protein KY461_14245 [Actinobacteria bacterium]|nr:hypothetical protein [Actinomycetota bacterium]
MLTPPTPHRVVPLVHELGTVAGHRLVLLSLEVYGTWSDLRFARIDVAGERPLPRRVPPAEAWTVSGPGGAIEVLDAVGRGDRAFSNGEVRLATSPSDAGETWNLTVELLPGEEPLTATLELPPA